jgi:hypothetical protein
VSRRCKARRNEHREKQPEYQRQSHSINIHSDDLLRIVVLADRHYQN